MAESGYADINAIDDLENGIRTFGHQMANASAEIELTINLYFQDFERGLHILEDRLRKAEEELYRAEMALERQRNKRVLVRDSDGDGYHWEHADCSAEEARVARCRATCDKCRRDVSTCSDLISDARSKRYIHTEQYSLLENNISVAVEKIEPVKELVKKHLSMQVLSSSASSGISRPFSTTTSSSASSISRGTAMTRPKPPINPNQSYGPKPSPNTERPRSPQNKRINPMPTRPFTEADRPRSPFGDNGRVTRNSVSSFKEGLNNILNKHKDDNKNE